MIRNHHCLALILALSSVLPSLALAQDADTQAADSKTEIRAITAEDADTNSVSSESPSTNEFGRLKHRGSIGHGPLVVTGRDMELKEGETAESVVVIGGSAKIRGNVREAVVVIGGNLDIEGGEVGEAAVVIMGSVRAGQGSV